MTQDTAPQNIATSAPARCKIVFLHIPKTAGQTIHSELERVLPADEISPIRVHSQAARGAAQLPPGYRLYSGHIDWEALDQVPQPRFVFTVLRDPLERIASFYFYLRRQAKALSPEDLASPERTGMRMALQQSPDEYFFGGTPEWKLFIRDHYDSTYCAYLISRRIRGYRQIAQMAEAELVDQALEVAEGLDGVYSVEDLGALEQDLKARAGLDVSLTDRFVNADPTGPEGGRWARLEAQLERPGSIAALRRFARPDQLLMHRLGLGPDPDA